jgi:FK506-binding protein 4/5
MVSNCNEVIDRMLIDVRQAAKFIEYDSSFTDEEKQQSKVLKISCKLNNVACKLKLKDYKEAEKLCSKVSCLISFTIILILR